MLYPYNDDRIVATDSVTLLHTMYNTVEPTERQAVR